MAMIAQIIPFTKLPRGLDYFDYEVPEHLQTLIKPGQIVSAPLRNRTIQGLVVRLSDRSAFDKIKPLTKIVESLPYIPEHQLALAQWFSKYYHYSLASTLRKMVPIKPKKSHSGKADYWSYGTFEVNTDKTADVAKQLLSHESKRFIAHARNPHLDLSLFRSLMDEVLKSKTQCLVLVPNYQRLKLLLSVLPKEYEEQCAVVTTKVMTAKNKYYNLWHEIKSQKKRIILGTRSAVFSCVPNLSLVYVDQSQADDHKSWDQTPRYNSISVARQLAGLTKSALVLSSPAPRVVDSYLTKKVDGKILSLGSGLAEENFLLVDMTHEIKKEFSYLSDPLVDQIKATLAENKSSVLIVNKKGFASYIRCNDCNSVPKCPDCTFPFTYDQESLHCFHCQRLIAVPEKCFDCSGPDMVPLGIGIEQVLVSLREMFPDKIISDSVAEVADIYVTTAPFTGVKHWAKVGFLAFVYIDGLLYFPDFSTNEQLYTLIHSVMNDYQLYSHNQPRVMLQTFFPENLAISSVMQPYDSFYQAESTSRERFGYPPYKTLLKLFFQHQDKAACDKEAKTLYTALNEQSKLLSGVTISEPYLYYRKKVRGKFRCQILLKLDKNNHKVEKSLLQIVPNNWRIDKDPLTVL